MGKAIFKVFFSIINGIVSVILSPVNTLVSGVFPDFSNMVNTFNSVVNTYIGGGVTWFFAILPPGTRSVVLIYLSFLVGYYTVSISLHAILKVYTIIKNIKFW